VVVRGSCHTNRYVREVTHRITQLLVEKIADFQLDNKLDNKFDNKLDINVDIKGKFIPTQEQDLDKDLDKDKDLNGLYLINQPDIMIIMDKISTSICNGLQDNWYRISISIYLTLLSI
jgi:hypothetical protein